MAKFHREAEKLLREMGLDYVRLPCNGGHFRYECVTATGRKFRTQFSTSPTNLDHALYSARRQLRAKLKEQDQ